MIPFSTHWEWGSLTVLNFHISYMLLMEECYKTWQPHRNRAPVKWAQPTVVMSLEGVVKLIYW